MANERHGQNIVDQRANTGDSEDVRTAQKQQQQKSTMQESNRAGGQPELRPDLKDEETHLRKAGDRPAAEKGAAPSDPEGAHEGAQDRVEIASDDSFPASDPPSWIARPSKKNKKSG